VTRRQLGIFESDYEAGGTSFTGRGTTIVEDDEKNPPSISTPKLDIQKNLSMDPTKFGPSTLQEARQSPSSNLPCPNTRMSHTVPKRSRAQSNPFPTRPSRYPEGSMISGSTSSSKAGQCHGSDSSYARRQQLAGSSFWRAMGTIGRPPGMP